MKTLLATLLLLQPFFLVPSASAAQLIERASVSSAGVEGNAFSGGGSFLGSPAISSSGRFVAFTTFASNFDAGDTNGVADVYVHDFLLGTTTRISVDDAGGQLLLTDCFRPAISADGRFVAFQTAGAFFPIDLNDALDVYLVDRDTDLDGIYDELGARTLKLASINFLGTAAGGGASEHASISADGTKLVFESTAADLMATADSNGMRDVFLRDLIAGSTTLVSKSTAGVQADMPSTDPWISADGTFVSFSSTADNLVAGDGTTQDIFLRDLAAGTTVKVSVGLAGAEGNGASKLSSLSSDGGLVCFQSNAGNLVAPSGSATPFDRVFVRDVAAGTTSVAVGGGLSFLPWARISGNGRYVAVWTTEDLLPTDTRALFDIYLLDRVSGEVQLVSLDDSGVQGLCGSSCSSGPPAIAADGSFVAFASGAPDLVAGDTNVTQDVFRRKTGRDMVLLAGDTSASTGSSVSYTWTGGPPLGTSWLFFSKKAAGGTRFGHAMEIGPALKRLQKATLDAAGAGAYTSPSIPAKFAGRTVHLEVLTRDAATQYYDSNETTLSIL